LLDEVFKTILFAGRRPAIPYYRVDGKTPLVVVVGDNASGKSLMRRIVQGLCKEAETECIHLSMEGRGGTHYNPFRSFIYGDESMESTGSNSAFTVLKGIETCRGRDKPHVIFWDEPDLGLSDSWAAGLGKRIREFAEDPPKLTLAIVLVTHSKPLVNQLLDLDPNYVHLGVTPKKASQTLTRWAELPVIPRDPEELRELSHKRFRTIQSVINNVKP
jgi:hypothetical protein